MRRSSCCVGRASVRSRPASRSRWRPTSRFRSATLVDIVTRVDSPALGICLDPGNCVAALELPTDTVEAAAPYVRNIHVKDFAFSRRDGWVGFTFAGCPLGEGLLDYRHLIDTPVLASAASARSSSTGCPGRATAPAPSAPKTTGTSTTFTT